MSNIVISVIVPNFNGESNSLEKCLRVFVNNYDERVEVIIIDDGSTDSNFAVLQELFAKICIRKKLIRITNHGQNYARSKGIEVASGKYIAFLDSDDYLNWNDFLSLLGFASNCDSDIIGFDCVCVDEEDQRIREYGFGHLSNCQPSQMKRLMLAHCAELWLQLVKRTIFAKHPLYRGSKIGEDFASIFPIIAEAKSISCCRLAPYYYVQHSNSIMHSSKDFVYASIVNSFKHVIECYPSAVKRFHNEIEWQAIHHILHLGVWKILRIGRFSKYASHLREWVFYQFPDWCHNTYYLSERKKLNFNSKLIIDGHFCVYIIIRNIKLILDKIRGE